MAEEVRRRAACDRCHAQKIRCPRRVGEAACDRCLKARTSCVFSPFRQKKPTAPSSDTSTPNSQTLVNCNIPTNENGPTGLIARKRKRVAAAVEQSLANDAILSDFNIEAFDNAEIAFNTFMNEGFLPDTYLNDFSLDIPESCALPSFNEPMLSLDNHAPDANNAFQQRRESNLSRSFECTSDLVTGGDASQRRSTPQSPGLSPTMWGSEMPKPDSLAECVQKLSTLSVGLFEHSRTIPPLSIHDPDSEGNLMGSKHLPRYNLDDTFRLTQDLVDIYPSLLNTLLSTSSSQTSSPNGNTSNVYPRESTNFTAARTSYMCAEKSKPLDLPSILLLLSCHLRLISIYESLMEHMHICIAQRGKPLTPEQYGMEGQPIMKIGNYVPPPSTAVPMQMLLFIQFASQLSNYASDLASEIQTPAASPSNTTSNGDKIDCTRLLTQATAENVKDRAQAMADKLIEFRQAMAKIDYRLC